MVLKCVFFKTNCQLSDLLKIVAKYNNFIYQIKLKKEFHKNKLK